MFPHCTSETSDRSEKVRNVDRLFVPLSTEPHQWFESGRKNWELRKLARQFTEKHVRIGRLVELRRGYSDPSSSIWGTIDEVVVAQNLNEFFSRVNWENVLPESDSLEAAIQDALAILGLSSADDTPVIGFEIDTDEPK